ncbi:glutamine amidotransferase [Halomonas aquamarina]|uniref:Glutamine amidotransferase n=1 Tax=Vreelandella aquamarina TaxID=77097 RepID=A0ACC5VTA3_9GAMM|nr:glutamine amidotransferase [Halomonas aquamarina]MBZ5487372.1 glutamine amidotransferase [Halomonas aquamarina]
MPSVLIVKTGDAFPEVAAKHGDFGVLFEQPMKRVVPYTIITVWDPRAESDAPALAGLDGIIITGSNSMISNAEPWSEALKPWLREARKRNIAMLGVCYGHQLMAEAFGGSAGDHPDGREAGTFEVERTHAADSDPLFSQLPTRFMAHLTHGQSVLIKPSDAVVLAFNSHDHHQALRYGPRQWSVQFHPEFNTDILRAYIERMEDALIEQGEDVSALIKKIAETPHSTSLLERFMTFL